MNRTMKIVFQILFASLLVSMVISHNLRTYMDITKNVIQFQTSTCTQFQSINSAVSNSWCQTSCTYNPPFCPAADCECSGNGTLPVQPNNTNPTNSSTTCPSTCSSQGGYCNTSTGQCVMPNPNSNIQQSIYLLSWQAWSTTQVYQLFEPACAGLASQLLIAFACPSQSTGFSFQGQSPNYTFPPNVSSQAVYKEVISQIYQKNGIKTLISIGGSSYAGNFSFLSSLSSSEISSWAYQVKAVVDSYGAMGVDLDYESTLVSDWQDQLVIPNVIGALRQAMPVSSGYVLSLTIPAFASFYWQPWEVGGLFSPPLTGFETALVGVAQTVIKQNYNDLDQINIMSYGNSPNLDPTQCLNLNRQSINYLLNINNSQEKLFLGAALGLQGKGCDYGWCNWTVTDVQTAAQYAYNNGFLGVFFWPNVNNYTDAQPSYQAAYSDLYQTSPQNLGASFCASL